MLVTQVFPSPFVPPHHIRIQVKLVDDPAAQQGIGVLTAAMLISGVAMIPFGIIHMFTQPLDGFFISGTGLILLGIGVLLLALAVLFYGRFLPFLIRSIVNTFNSLLHRGRCKS